MTPLVMVLRGPRDIVLCISGGEAYMLDGVRWIRLTLSSQGLGGWLMAAPQRDALFARVGQP